MKSLAGVLGEKKIDQLQYQLKSWDACSDVEREKFSVKLPRHAGWFAMLWHQIMEKSCSKLSREKK